MSAHLESPALSPASARSPFAGLWIATVTPFKQVQPDLPALRRLVARLSEEGVSGLVVCGSTGEAAALNQRERLAVLDAVLDATRQQGRVLPVAMGVGGHNLEQVRAELKALSGRPLAGVLLAAPPYIRPSQAGLIEWFTELADASPAPVVLYDIPYRAGVAMARDTLLTLAAHPNIHAIKDCGGDTAKALALIADGRLQVMAGEDLNLFGTLAQGGAGIISACAQVLTPRFASLVQHLARGDLAQARAQWLPLVPLIEALLAEPNPALIKWLLAQQGEMANELRAPMQTASPAACARLAQVVARQADTHAAR